MKHILNQFHDTSEPNILANNDINYVQTINDDFKNLQSIEEFQENISKSLTKSFDINQTDFIIKTLTKILKILEIESERAQQITTNFHNQCIALKTIGEKFSQFCDTCRSLIVHSMNIHQNTRNFTYREFEMLTRYTPENLDIVFDQSIQTNDKNRFDNYQHRIEFSRSIITLFKQARKLRFQIASLNNVLIKSVLSKNECFQEIEQSLHLPSNIFNQNIFYDLFLYEIPITAAKQNVYISCIRGQLTQNDMHIICTENSKHLLSQIKYNACEKYSYIFDIEFKRAITSIDQVTIALPCFTLPEKLSSQQKIYIRCKRMMDSLIYIPALIETYNDISYAIFRITQSLSAISVEAVLYYPFEILQAVQKNSSSVYTSEHAPEFQIETSKNYFIRPPRVRIIPFNTELLRFMTALRSEDQLIASSDLIEFEWYKDLKNESILTVTIPLTHYFTSNNEINDDLQKRRRKAQQKILVQRRKFEQEKYDEAGGSLATSPTSNNRLTSPSVMSHLPSISAILEQVKTNYQENLIQPKFTLSRDDHAQLGSSKKTLFKWKLDGFQNENAPIILLGYKNRKWKNCNNVSSITRVPGNDIYIINLTTLLDRIILIRCWPESTNEGKYDKLAEYLWSLTSAKLFSCVLARDPSFLNSYGHYGLMIVPVEKEQYAEEFLHKRNYTECIYDEQISYDSNSITQLPNINQYQSHHSLSIRTILPISSKYVQFCLSEGTCVRIIPMGNIDVHEKVDLNFRLHAQYPTLIEFDIYPIDIYRQKTNEDFIGTLNIYEITTHNNSIGSTSSTLTAAAVSSRTSSGSKELDITDGIRNNSSPQISLNGPETSSNNGFSIGRSGFERLTVRDVNEKNIACIIRIHLPKSAFQLSSIESNRIVPIVPDFFMKIMEELKEDKYELAQALNIHSSLMNSLVTSLLSQQHHSQTNLLSYRNSKVNLVKDNLVKSEQTKLENETLLKWLKRQNVFNTKQIVENIISALIQIGRVDLAYMFKIENLTYKCSNL